MKEIFLPKPKTDTGGKISDELDKFVIPDNMSQKDELDLYPEFLSKLSEKIKEICEEIININKKINENEIWMREQSNKNIEVIGIFSAVLALLIVDVSIIKSETSFLLEILLITALTCSVAIFAILIHVFFTPSDKIKFGKYIWIPLGILILFIILGMISNWNDLVSIFMKK